MIISVISFLYWFSLFVLSFIPRKHENQRYIKVHINAEFEVKARKCDLIPDLYNQYRIQSTC